MLPEWKSHRPESAISANAGDRSKLAAAVSSAAKTWKPPATLAVPSIDDLGPDVPRNLHERLALVARLQLAEHLQDAAVAPSVHEFTTTDVTAALSVAGVILTEKGKRTVGAAGGGLEGGARVMRGACLSVGQAEASGLQGRAPHVSRCWPAQPTGHPSPPSATSAGSCVPGHV